MLGWIDRIAQGWLDWRMDHRKYDVGFKRMEIGPDGMVAEFVSPASAVLADQCSVMLTKANAKNYVQFDMYPSVAHGIDPVRVTVQWARGESPAQQNERLRNELAKYADSGVDGDSSRQEVVQE